MQHISVNVRRSVHSVKFFFFLAFSPFFFSPHINMCSCSSSLTGDLPATVRQTDNVLRVPKVDETVNTTFVCEVVNRIGTVREQVAVLVRGELSDADKCNKASAQAAFMISIRQHFRSHISASCDVSQQKRSHFVHFAVT